MKKLFSLSPMWRFILSFLILYCLLYSVNYVWMGFTIPGGYYSSWLHYNLDYISAMRHLILKGSSTLLSLLSYENHIYGYFLTVTGIKTIRMVYSCIGLNILCLWWAFALSFPQKWKQRIIQLVVGSVIIIMLNIIRITLVALMPLNGTFLNTPFNHHDVFNVIVYGIIIIMVRRAINKAHFTIE